MVSCNARCFMWLRNLRNAVWLEVLGWGFWQIIAGPVLSAFSRYWRREQQIDREMKIMNSLWNKYPTEDFWLKLTLPWTLNSLAFLKSGRGGQELEKKYNEYTYTPPELETPPDLGDKKIGEDKKITKGRMFLDEL